MRCKLIILFLFFEINIFCVTTEGINRHETFSTCTASQKNQSNAASFVLLNPKQIQHAEAIIKYFLARLTGPMSIGQPITLRLSSPNGGNLESTISGISKMIRAKIMEFVRSSGLTASVRQYKQTLWNSTISKDWFTESLVQGSLLLHDLFNIGEEVRFAIDHHFKTYNMILYEDKELSLRKTTRNFKFFNTINDAASFSEKLFKCLLPVTNRRNPTSSFNLNRAFANLARESPDNTVKSFKSSLDRAFVLSAPSNGTASEQLYMLLCHSLVERISLYGDCIKELRRFVTCMSSSSNEDLNGTTHHRFLPKPWLSVIERLSGCKVNIDENGNANIHCNFHRRLPKTTKQQVKYIYEKMLNQRISRRSPLYRVANELGNALSRSRWGRQLTYDICQYFAIYQEGQRRLNMLSKNATKNKRAAMRYKKMSVSLNIYKNGVLKKTMLAIENIHHSALEIQKYLIRGIRSSFEESWKSHFKILVCLSEWMQKLLELFGCGNLSDTDVDTSISTDTSSINMTDLNSASEPDENNQMKHLSIYSRKDQLRKEADITFEKLMRLMNHISRMRSRNDKSTLACLANNLLLVTMFMETISFVSTLFCLGEHKDESNPEQIAEEWDLLGRERRSLLFGDFAEIDTIKKVSPIVPIAEEIGNIYAKNYINSVQSVPTNATNNSYGLIRTTLRSDE
ncbi:uncharacterized protein LOC105194864 isoform X2 [Solenopsis invicta]|uniref:uncharacterized protein LOC105194864 isoform X2 n=1 Tax=Solenopsis invicta TaxID=13686 RepID=UPI00193CC90C|nr:uncharacterized protein LOC105194864 isoform X2 [Solenopsis invicta]